MKFSVTLDSVRCVISPSETSEGFTWKQAIDDVLEYCRDSGYSLQEDYFELVEQNQDEYISGNFPVVLG